MESTNSHFSASPLMFETAEVERREISRLRAMSVEQRGREIADACRLAADILDGRRNMGMPDPPRDPWPPSTIEILAKHAAEWTIRHE